MTRCWFGRCGGASALVGMTVAALAFGALGSGAGAAEGPTVTGPVTGGTRGHAQTTAEPVVDLAAAGYVENEFFVAGTAAPYAPVGSWTSDGNSWTAEKTTPTAAFNTRIIVRRPTNPKKFNGTVVVEWMNVTGAADATADFLQVQRELLDGYAHVGVSAQLGGVDGSPLRLKQWDAARYGSLVHPGDSYSYDIFSQAGQALRRPSGADPLGNLRSKVKRFIADGESQSAGRLVTYVNAIQPLDHVYDGFFLHSRGAGGAPLTQAPLPTVGVPNPALIRTDLDAPVMTIENETDVPSFAAARQPETSKIRTWELAGTSHYDQYGIDAVVKTAANDFPQPEFPVLLPTCSRPLNSTHARYVYDAAMHHLNEWVQGGSPPPTGAPMRLDPNNPTDPIARDAHGNALGGVRLPEIEVPTATQSAFGNVSVTPPNFCALFGVKTPFDQATLAALYPNHAAYVSAFNRAVKKARKAGVLLGYDAKDAKIEAANSDIGR
jgi:hypothetical protein